ncbi:MAG: class I SAM-dependent DNA methyltransferase [Pikeienuella sp.]
MVRKFLIDAFSHPAGEAAERFYDEWAETYDEELAESGYAAPRRCARALAAAMEARDRPVLDLGCGTGLSGVALRAEGFRLIDGWDPAAEMLRFAEGRDIYRVLRQIEPDRSPSAPPGSYAAIVAVSVFAPWLAPPEAIRQSLRLLPQGGLLCLSLNDPTLTDGDHDAMIRELINAGDVREISREHGEDIRALDMGSDVVVLRKT